MNSIADLYNMDPGREWGRLTKSPYNQLEFMVFLQHILQQFPAKGLILDAGGGPGRYAIELCRRGYDVVLLDASAGCVELAQSNMSKEDNKIQHRLKDCIVGDVADLSVFENEMFDAVLCLDPLSCIADENGRRKAMTELVRVAKTGAVLAIAVRGYLDVLRTIMRLGGQELINGDIDKLRSTGNCACCGVEHHFFSVQEIKKLAEQAGLQTILAAGGEGLSSGMPEATEKIYESTEKWQRWCEIVFETSTDPAVADLSGHMLYMGRKGG